MQKTLFLILACFAGLSAFSQTSPVPRPSYSADSFLLRSNGPRIFLYSFCPAYGDPGRAVYFRKDQDSVYHRVSMRNLRVALADNPASMQQLHLAGTGIGIGFGLLAGGLVAMTAGIISTVHKNNEAQNAFSQASAQWFAQSQAHPYANNPMPTLTHYSASPLIWLGPLMSLSCIIPLVNAAKHTRKAIDVYNGIR